MEDVFEKSKQEIEAYQVFQKGKIEVERITCVKFLKNTNQILIIDNNMVKITIHL